MRRYPHGETKAESDHNRDTAREVGMKFDTPDVHPDIPWKKQLKKLSEVLLDDPQFQPKP